MRESITHVGLISKLIPLEVALLKTVSCTFQDLNLIGHYNHPICPLFITITVSTPYPIIGKHVIITKPARWIFLLSNSDRQDEMQIFAKFKNIMYTGLRTTLNFQN